MYSFGESISIFNCIDVQQDLIQYIDQCDNECVIDASSLSDIDACGIQLIVSLAKYCEKKEIPFEMVGIVDQIELLFQKLGLDMLIGKDCVTHE